MHTLRLYTFLAYREDRMERRGGPEPDREGGTYDRRTVAWPGSFWRDK